MSMPFGVAVDPVSGKVFVAEYGNNRVLRFAALVTLENGAPAEAVLGQPDFTTTTGTTTQSGMLRPYGLAVDSAGRLWVADGGNNRVLRFDDAANKASGDPADGVLGQPDFTSSGIAVSQTGMYRPMSIAADAAGHLWISGEGHRVLRFDAAATKANGAPADGVLGQPNFTSAAAATSQAGMRFSYGVAVDNTGHLWVSDLGNNRVLRFDAAATKANGAPADGVLGQPDFTSSAAATSSTSLNTPYRVAADTAGHVWVADQGNHRVLRFDAAATKANGDPADGVLGQPDFISNGYALTQSRMASPYGMAADSDGRLWVADPDYNRVTVYGQAQMTVLGNGQAIANGSTTPSPSDDTDFGSVTVGQSIVHTFAITNSGNVVLNLTGTPAVALSGANAGDFSVTQLPTSTVTLGGSTTFMVSFAPSAAGLRSATITIANDDTSATPYTFAIQGSGASGTPTATGTPAATPISTPTATSTPTPPPSFAYIDVGNVRVWADTFVPNGAGYTASGNLAFGPRATNSRYFGAGGASWTNTSAINLTGVLSFNSGASIGQGTFTVDTAGGGISWASGSTLMISKLGSSNLPLSATVTMNALQPTITVNAQISLALPENSGKTFAASYTLAGDGTISSGVAGPISLSFAGGKLNATVTPGQTGLTAPQAQLVLGSLTLALPELLIDGNGTNKLRLGSGASFSIPEVTVGASKILKLTKMSASINVGANEYYVSLNTTIVILKANGLAGALSPDVSGTLKIAKGHISGTTSALGLGIGGVQFNADKVSFVDNKLAAESTTLNLPVKGATVKTTAYGLEIGGDAGFRLQGGKISLPDFKIGTVGLKSVTIEFKKEQDEYTVAGTAKFQFTKFAVSGTFKIGYSAQSGLSIKSVHLEFEGKIPYTAIPIGTTGFYIVRVSGGFDLEDGSLKLTLGLGASSKAEIGSRALVDLDGSVTLQIKPSFALSTNASMKLVGLTVASVDMKLTSSSFSLKGRVKVSIIKASFEITFGTDIDGKFTFYGSVEADATVPKGYFLEKHCIWKLCSPQVPNIDLYLGSVKLDGGKFRKGGDTIWGARGEMRVLGIYNMYAWAKFGPGDSDYGRGGKLKDYEPVRPSANSTTYQLARPATHLIAASSRADVTVTSPAGYLVLVELVDARNRQAMQEAQISGPKGAHFTATLGYEQPDHSLRLYRIDLASASDAVGQWSFTTQPGNEVFVQGAEPPPEIDSFSGCLQGGTCLNSTAPLTVEQGQPINLQWVASANTPGLVLDVDAVNAEGTHYPLAHQETQTEKGLSGSLSWRSAVPAGTYTLTLQLEAEGFAPIKARRLVTIHDTTAPPAPAGLQAVAGLDMSAQLSWVGSAAPADVAGYQVAYDGNEPIAVDGRFATYVIAGLPAGTTHTVSVAAYDLSGNLGPAAVTTVTLPRHGVAAAWPQRSGVERSVSEVGLSLNTPIVSGTLHVSDAYGKPVIGNTAATVETTTITDSVTLGATFVPASGELPRGHYTARFQALDATSGAPITYSWSFDALPRLRYIYFPWMKTESSSSIAAPARHLPVRAGHLRTTADE